VRVEDGPGGNASQAAFHAAPERPRCASHEIILYAIADNGLMDMRFVAMRKTLVQVGADALKERK
jgi:hypothetical protein